MGDCPTASESSGDLLECRLLGLACGVSDQGDRSGLENLYSRQGPWPCWRSRGHALTTAAHKGTEEKGWGVTLSSGATETTKSTIHSRQQSFLETEQSEWGLTTERVPTPELPNQELKQDKDERRWASFKENTPFSLRALSSLHIWFCPASESSEILPALQEAPMRGHFFTYGNAHALHPPKNPKHN